MQTKCLSLVGVIIAVSGSMLHGQQNELHTLANGLAEDIAATGKKSIAVVDFTDLQGNPTELGRYLAEELSVALLKTHKQFEIIDRTHLKTILTENKLASTGLIDPATAKKLGRIVGADLLLTGSMTPFSENVRIAVKVLMTDTARIVAADTADLPKTATIIELLRNSVLAAGPSNPLKTPIDPITAPIPAQLTADQIRTAERDQKPRTVIVEEFVYELVECKGIGSSVQCLFRVTNRGLDRYLGHYCTYATSDRVSSAFDNFGNQVRGAECSLSNAPKNDDAVYATLLSGVPVTAMIVFRNLDASASRLARVTITAQWADAKSRNWGKVFEPEFRDIPIVR